MTQVRTNEDVVSLIGFLEYYLPIIDFKTPTKINAGGCGFFAKHLHLVLKEMGFDSELTYSIAANDEGNMTSLKENNRFPEQRFGVYHVVVNLTPYIAFDSEGMTKPLILQSKIDKTKHIGSMTVEQLDILWNNVNSWNRIFDRDCCDFIVGMLSELPQKYEQFLKEGFIDLPELNEGTALTRKTREAIYEVNPFAAMMGAF